MTSFYSDAEITLPPGVSERALDWAVLAWDLRGEDEWNKSEELLAQHIVTPDAVVMRTNSVEYGLFSVEYQLPFRSTRTDRGEYSSMVEWSIRDVEGYFSRGFKWNQKPFVVDFTKSKAGRLLTEVMFQQHPDYIFDNIGEVMYLNNNRTLEIIFKEVARVRKELNTP